MVGEAVPPSSREGVGMIQREVLRGKPFDLGEEDIEWVEATLNAMTQKEKIGQLFFLTGYTNNKEYLTHISRDLQVGGCLLYTYPSPRDP